MKALIYHKQQGVTLIELMVSLVISVIVLLAVTSIYVTSKRSYALQDSLARQQENGRFAVEILSQDLRMASFQIDDTTDHSHAPFIPATTSEGGNGAANDTITIQYESNTDCLGRATPLNSCRNYGGALSSGQRCAINQYSIDANNNLVCLGNGGPNPEVIVERVYNLQVLYGVDTDNTKDGTANKYVTWNNVSTSERKGRIVSVRFGLLVSTPTETARAQQATTYNILDQTLNINDRRINRVYTSTVVLRNQL